ncbi:protein-tyrosine phosphatase [Eubacterium ruminantium]|nr:protein-tyrosine phosphatase [Eubacterium ruminantium]
MEYLIDMHDHIVPGVDDGSQSMEESMALIDMEYKEGVRKIICTPHYIRGQNRYEYAGLEESFEKLRQKVSEKYPDMELYLGNEVLIENGITDDIRSGGLIHSMAGGKYMLFEFNIRIPYHELYDAIKAVVETRVRPIIAHVERYRCLVGHLDRIEELKSQGLLLQINADSLEGGLFDENTRWCKKLISGGYIEFISSDCHDPENRIPSFKAARTWIRKKLGEDMEDALFRGNAEKVINNVFIQV